MPAGWEEEQARVILEFLQPIRIGHSSPSKSWMS
jgi:hypothetical protein